MKSSVPFVPPASSSPSSEQPSPTPPAPPDGTLYESPAGPFPSSTGGETYRVRVTSDKRVLFEYSLGRVEEVRGLTPERIEAWERKGIWRKMEDRVQQSDGEEARP